VDYAGLFVGSLTTDRLTTDLSNYWCVMQHRISQKLVDGS